MKTLSCAAVIALFCTMHTSAGDSKPKGDLAALQGAWKVWFEKDDYIVFEVNGNSFSMTRHGRAGQATAKGSLTLDEKANPKQMTWQDIKGLGVEVNKCIYELHGDTWLLIGGVNERPEHFYSRDGDPKTWILKRVKKDN